MISSGWATIDEHEFMALNFILHRAWEKKKYQKKSVKRARREPNRQC